MEQYIKKSALVAEIEKLYNGEIDTYTRNILDRLKSNINALEVKEVDIDKEITKLLDNGMALQLDWTQCNIEVKPDGLRKLAKHFFELGMVVSNKAQKGGEI